MTRHRSIASLLAVVAAALVTSVALVLPAPGTAYAASPWPWRRTCTDVALTQYGASMGGASAWLSGSIQPCAGQDPVDYSSPAHQYSFMLYFAGRAAPSKIIRRLPDQPYTFEVFGRWTEPVRAVCLIDQMRTIESDRYVDLFPSLRACIGIDQADPSAEAVATPIPTTDERLKVRARVTQYPIRNTNPACAACL